ncbi:MAG: putative transport system permease protein [Thermoanaerobaculia bacterium]|jgi:putative ABC transport system permease protein|nr:putative transport system permease protein [Thermoanaerobaculia bacterium]
MEFGPIIRALKRNKVRFLLIVVQIAITLAVVTNAITMIRDESVKMMKTSGFDDENIVWVRTKPFAPGFKDLPYRIAAVNADLRAIQATPGVVAVANTNFLPWQGGGSSGEVAAGGGDGSKFRTQMYTNTPGILDALGVHLVSGRGLRDTDIDDDPNSKAPSTAIISRDLERLVFKGKSAIGRQLQDSDNTVINVVGTFDPFYNPYGWPIHEYAVFYAGHVSRRGAMYLVRVAPGSMKQTVPLIEKRMLQANNGRNIDMKTISEIKDNYFAQGRIVRTTMSMVIALIVLVTGLGIVGVTAFSVTERRKQIGTRRALGATKASVLRYFLLENWIVTNAGLILGVAAAYGLNVLLVTKTAGAKLDWRIVVAAVVLLWIQGIIATLIPAMRATRFSPVIATRGA